MLDFGVLLHTIHPDASLDNLLRFAQEMGIAVTPQNRAAPRERFYRGIPVIRHYGPAYGGFAYFYDDVGAFPFLGFTAWELALAARLDEEQMRAHEQAIVDATTAPVDDTVAWNDGPASGSVTLCESLATAVRQASALLGSDTWVSHSTLIPELRTQRTLF